MFKKSLSAQRKDHGDTYLRHGTQSSRGPCASEGRRSDFHNVETFLLMLLYAGGGNDNVNHIIFSPKAIPFCYMTPECNIQPTKFNLLARITCGCVKLSYKVSCSIVNRGEQTEIR